MLLVLVKVATYVNGAVHRAGEKIEIEAHLFSEEVHELIEDLEKRFKPAPVSPPAADSAAPAAIPEAQPLPAAPSATEEKTP